MRIVNFRGVQPKTHATALDPNGAQFAENCLLYGGAIRPLRAPSFYGEPVTPWQQRLSSRPLTLFKRGGVWFGSELPMTWVRDVLERDGPDGFLFVQDGKLYRSNMACACGTDGPIEVGIHRPCAAPGAVVQPGGCTPETFPLPGCADDWSECADSDAPLTLSWAFTYVNCMFEESAPSPLSEPILVDSGNAVLLADTGTPPANATSRRWYETLVGGDGSVDMFLIAETPIEQSAYMHCPHSFTPNDILQTQEYDEIPPCISGVSLVGDAVTVLWEGRELFFSEPRQPHAYPRKWWQRVDHEIRKVVAVTRNPEDNVHYHGVVLTEGSPYLLEGELPEDIRVRRLPVRAPCTNPAGVVTIGDVVVFPSEDGVLAIQNGTLVNLTSDWLTKDEWHGFRPDSTVLGFYDHRLFVFNREDAAKSFMLPWPNQNSPYQQDMVYLSHNPSAVFHDEGEVMAVAGLQHRLGVYGWEQGQDRLRAVWHSKEFTQRGNWHGNAAKVLTDAERVPPHAKPWIVRACQMFGRMPYPDEALRFIRHFPEAECVLPYLSMPATMFEVYATRELQYSRPVWRDTPFRIKRDRRAVDWSFAVRTTAVVHEIHLQTSMDDLTQEGGHG